jgi:drug/metabolite transporter (DMT)-like permease
MPYLCLLFNALIWGMSWWPLRHLQALGLHPLWATMIFFMLGATLIGLWRPQAFAVVRRTPGLWWLALATGATNAAFNWGVSVGEVVRVVLLFYLMPLWAVLLAWWLLGERISRGGALRVLLALLGALLVLKPEGGAWPQFNGLADWLGLLGGMGFALTNVLLRRQVEASSAARALAMFMGGIILPGLLGVVLSQQGLITGWPAFDWAWLLGALGLGLAFFSSNMALQYGAAHVPVNMASVVMLTEVVFASASAVWLGGEVLTPTILTGGGLILLAALLSTQARD